MHPQWPLELAPARPRRAEPRLCSATAAPPRYAGAPGEQHAGSASTLGSSPSRFPPLRPTPTPVQPPSASSTGAPPPDDAAEHPTPATSFNTQLGEHPGSSPRFCARCFSRSAPQPLEHRTSAGSAAIAPPRHPKPLLRPWIARATTPSGLRMRRATPQAKAPPESSPGAAD